VCADSDSLRGGYLADQETRAAKDLRFTRGALRFRVDGKYAGQAYTLAYKGRARGNAIPGPSPSGTAR
jgi:hypothetical protein